MTVYSPNVVHLCTATTPASLIMKGRLKRYVCVECLTCCVQGDAEWQSSRQRRLERMATVWG